MMTEQCNSCAWLYIDDDQEALTCEAFAPGPIPEAILTGEVSHGKPYPGQTEPEIVYLPMWDVGT